MSNRALLLAAAAVLCSAPSAQTTTDASWGLFPFLVGNQDSEIPTIVAQAAANGVDTLYVSTFRATGRARGDLWITDRAGWNSAWGPVRPGGAGIDLVALVNAAHARNIRVVAVLKCFADSVQPTSSSHRQFLLDVIDYLVRSYNPDGTPVYDIDGLALDYIRFVSSGTGNDPSVVTNFVGQIREHVGVLSLHAYLLANRYSFDGPTYDTNFNSYTSTMASLKSQFGQDWEGLARYLDVYMPMCYTSDGSIYNTWQEHWAYVRQAALYASSAVLQGGFAARRVVPVVATYDMGSGTATTPQTIDASVKGALDGFAEGYQSFRFGTMRNNSSWMTAFHAYAAAGPNWPIARCDATVSGLTVTLDSTGSSDLDEPASQLAVAYDLDDDGQLDTPWQPPGIVTMLLQTAAGQRIGMHVRDSQGQVAATTRFVAGSSSLAVSSPFYSASVAQPLDIRIDAGPGAAGSLYLVLCSMSGSTPGFVWNGIDVPLTYDGFTDGMLSAVNTPLLANGLGTCDAQGQATATFWIPSGFLTPLLFTQMTFAAIAVEPTTNAPRFVTNSAHSFILH